MAYHYHSPEELAEYYKTDTWHELRRQTIKRSEGYCTRCRNAGLLNIGVDVHHINYPEVLGTESVEFDLIHLCRECHLWTHSRSAYDPTNPNSPCELRHKKIMEEYERQRIERENIKAARDRLFDAEIDDLMAQLNAM